MREREENSGIAVKRYHCLCTLAKASKFLGNYCSTRLKSEQLKKCKAETK